MLMIRWNKKKNSYFARRQHSSISYSISCCSRFSSVVGSLLAATAVAFSSVLPGFQQNTDTRSLTPTTTTTWYNILAFAHRKASICLLY